MYPLLSYIVVMKTLQFYFVLLSLLIRQKSLPLYFLSVLYLCLMLEKGHLVNWVRFWRGRGEGSGWD